MKLQLKGNATIGQVKKEFSHFFPFLKLEFFSQPHKAGSGSSVAELLDNDLQLGEINPSLKDTTFFIDPADSVAFFEQHFQNEYGIAVQVFRKSGQTWLETIHTDHLSLMRQNEMGMEYTRPMRFNVFTLFL